MTTIITLEQWDSATIEQRQEWLNTRVILDAESATKLIAQEKAKRIGRTQFASAGATRNGTDPIRFGNKVSPWGAIDNSATRKR